MGETELIRYRIYADRFEPACRSMDRRAIVVIAIGVVGALFSVFWVIFGFIVYGMGVAPIGTTLLLILVGGVLPLLGCSLVLWAGIARRVSSSRLRDLSVLSSRFDTINALELGGLLRIAPSQADKLLAMALQRGLVSAFPGLEAPRRVAQPWRGRS